MIIIRKLQSIDDCWSVGKIYVDSWKYTYRKLLPQKYLDDLSAEQWVNKLNQSNRYSLVAELEGKLIGTASYGKSRDSECTKMGEIYSIYFLPQYMGMGYGKQLINTVIIKLKALVYKSIFLWVLEDNLNARKFYEKVGFIYSGKIKEVKIGSKNVKEVQYIYRFDYK